MTEPPQARPVHTTASTEPGRFKDSSARPDATGFPGRSSYVEPLAPRVSAILRTVALPGADDEAQLGHVRQAPDRLGVNITDHIGTDDREPDLGAELMGIPSSGHAVVADGSAGRLPSRIYLVSTISRAQGRSPDPDGEH
jgi:hypothetical protein